MRERVGADLLLTGSYLSIPGERGSPIRVDLRLQEAGTGETLAVVSEKAPVSELDSLAARAGARLREKLDVGAVPPSESAAVRAALPDSPEAARLYAEGLATLRRFDDAAARMLLEKSVAAEPGHALAHSALAAAWAGLG